MYAYLDGILLGFGSHRVPASMDLGHMMRETKSAIAEFAFLPQHVNVGFATFQVAHVVHFIGQTQEFVKVVTRRLFQEIFASLLLFLLLLLLRLFSALTVFPI